MSAQSEQASRPRLLVVDDDPQTATLVRSWFTEDKFEILEAADGAAGIEIARREAPDLVLMDLRMPNVDGFSAAKTLKSDPETSVIPVVVLTACRDLDAKVEALKSGADDYLTKPFDLEDLDARVQAMLARRDYLLSLESRLKNLAASKEQLEKLLTLDEKTGLYNFREFRRALLAEWERTSRYDVPLSLVFLDIDHFKQVNDTLGHVAGDKVLREFATLVAGGARTNDVAARYGGEEFAVILPHTDGEMAVRVAERIRQAVSEFIFVEDEKPTRITVSCGVATYPSDAQIDSVDTLIRAADEALYVAKDGGRDRVVQADARVRAEAAKRPSSAH